jgi:hypothetical protein
VEDPAHCGDERIRAADDVVEVRPSTLLMLTSLSPSAKPPC